MAQYLVEVYASGITGITGGFDEIGFRVLILPNIAFLYSILAKSWNWICSFAV